MACKMTKTCDHCGAQLEGKNFEVDAEVTIPASRFNFWGRSYKHFDLCSECGKIMLQFFEVRR